MSLPSSRFRWEPLYLLELTDGRVFRLPSRLPPVFKQKPSRHIINGRNGTQKGRVTGGIIILPPAPQYLCTKGFRAKTGGREGHLRFLLINLRQYSKD